MNFLDPKIDFVFKKLFGTITNKDTLIFFLNSILEKKESEKIIDVKINDPINIQDRKLSKESIVDVRCTDKQNKHYIIEMQVVKEKDFKARAQYYTALALSRQLVAGNPYEMLEPVIFIGILDFTLFKKETFFSHYIVVDDETYDETLPHTEYYFMELPKFTKTIAEIITFREKWAYFFKYAKNFTSIPELFEQSNFNQAFDVLAESNWSREERETYDRIIHAERCRQSEIKTAIEDALLEGKTEEKINIAKEMLKEKLNIELISKVTGLTIEEIKTIKE